MIKLVRVDYRLLHGQVTVSWLNRYSISRMVIINDNAYNSEMIKKTFKMSKPSNLKMNIFSVEEALKRKNKISNLKENVALIFGNVFECYTFINEFPSEIKNINYGNIPQSEGSTDFSKTVSLNDKEIKMTKDMMAAGRHIFCQQIPDRKAIDLKGLI